MAKKTVESFTSKRILKWVGLTILIAVGAIGIIVAIGVLLYYVGPTIGKWLLSQIGGIIFGMIFTTALFAVVMSVLEKKSKYEEVAKPNTEPNHSSVRRMPAKPKSQSDEEIPEEAMAE